MGKGTAQPPLYVFVCCDIPLHLRLKAHAAPAKKMVHRPAPAAQCHAPHIHPADLAAQQKSRGLDDGFGVNAAWDGQVQLPGEDVARASGQHRQYGVGAHQPVNNLSKGAVSADEENQIRIIGHRQAGKGRGVARPQRGVHR